MEYETYERIVLIICFMLGVATGMSIKNTDHKHYNIKVHKVCFFPEQCIKTMESENVFYKMLYVNGR